MKSAGTEYLTFEALAQLKQLGLHITLARQARLKRQIDVAKQALISSVTYRKIERGDPSVAIGNYVSVLHALGLMHTLSAVANPAQDNEAQINALRLAHRIRLSAPLEFDNDF